MLIVLYTSAFIGAFNENAVNVILVDIMSQFEIASTTAQWLVTGYMIVTCIVVVMTAWLMRRFSLRQLFFAACGFFCAAGLAQVLAPTWPSLLAARLVQAVGSGLFIPLMMGTVLAIAPRNRMGTFLSLGSASITLGPALGPVVSGAAATFFGWRAVFVTPVIICMALGVAAVFSLRNVHETEHISIDVISLLLITVGLTLFVYGLGELSANLFTGVAGIVVGLTCIAVFALRQGRIAQPLLSMRPFSDRRFSLACVLVLVSMMTTFSMSVLLPLYFEGVFGSTALEAGALILPAIIANAATAVVAGRVMDKRGPWPLIPLGFFCMVVGQAFIVATAQTMDLVAVVSLTVVVYAGVGLAMAPSQTAGLRILSQEIHGDGVSILNAMNMVAASIGPALFIGILSSREETAIAAAATPTEAISAGFASAIMIAAIIAAAGLAASIAFSLQLRNEIGEITQKTHSETTDKPESKKATGFSTSNRTILQTDIDSHALSLASIMKHDAYTVNQDACVADVIALLAKCKTSGLPVVDELQHVIGFISDGDIMRALSAADQQSIDLGYYLVAIENEPSFAQRVSDLLASNVMELANHDVVYAQTSDTLDDVCATLSAHRLKKVPVVDTGVLVGTISRSDIVRAIMQHFAM